MTNKINRRDFIKYTGAGTGSLIVALYAPELLAQENTGAIHQFVEVGTDNKILIRINRPEMGQGTSTSMPMLIADEMDADWGLISVEWAPVSAAFNTSPLVYGVGGSASVRESFDELRIIGAGIRALMVGCAARQWGVPAHRCATRSSYVIHPDRQQKSSYGSLVEKASAMPFPEDIALKKEHQRTIIGQRLKSIDSKEKVIGQAAFGIDVEVPGALVGAVIRSPVRGGKLIDFDAAEALKIEGVKLIKAVETGVGIVAESYWQVNKAKNSVEINWDNGPLGSQSTETIRQRFWDAMDEQPTFHPYADNQLVKDLQNNPATQSREYEVPYAAHAALEPMNCTAHFAGDLIELWVPVQNPFYVKRSVARFTGYSQDQIKVHPQLMGGSFGRKFTSDYLQDAVELSKAAAAPVKVIWSREDDTRQSPYRTFCAARIAAAVDGSGLPKDGVDIQISGTSFRAWNDDATQSIIDNEHSYDGSMVEGICPPQYRFPKVSLRQYNVDPGIKTMWWRSVSNSFTAFFMESYIDELAALAEIDPIEYRIKLYRLANPWPPGNTRQGFNPETMQIDVMVNTLHKLKEVSDWDAKRKAGTAIGMACWYSFGSYVAQAVELRRKDDRLHIDKVYAVVDCGLAVNPNIIEQQIQGSIMFALGPVVKSAITFDDGRVEQSNFHDYQVIRMQDAPKVDVHILENSEQIGGIGEPGVPPVAPAVANAVFAATGNRIRKLPLGLN